MSYTNGTVVLQFSHMMQTDLIPNDYLLYYFTICEKLPPYVNVKK